MNERNLYIAGDRLAFFIESLSAKRILKSRICHAPWAFAVGINPKKFTHAVMEAECPLKELRSWENLLIFPP